MKCDRRVRQAASIALVLLAGLLGVAMLAEAAGAARPLHVGIVCRWEPAVPYPSSPASYKALAGIGLKGGAPGLPGYASWPVLPRRIVRPQPWPMVRRCRPIVPGPGFPR